MNLPGFAMGLLSWDPLLPLPIVPLLRRLVVSPLALTNCCGMLIWWAIWSGMWYTVIICDDDDDDGMHACMSMHAGIVFWSFWDFPLVVLTFSRIILASAANFQ